MPRPSGFARVLAAFVERGVDFVVVGVGGINFYARTPSDAFATLDLDTLLRPTVETLATALAVLGELGFDLEAGGEPFLDAEDPRVLETLVARGASLSAIHSDGTQIDVMTSIAGFDYAGLADDATLFEVSGTPVRVGRLTKLLRAKEAAGRPKDLDFLRAFEAHQPNEEPEGS